VLTIKRPSPGYAEEFLAAVRRSRRLHKGWVSPPADLEQFRQYVKSQRLANRKGFLVVDGDSSELAGVINVTEIVRGAFQSAYLGYYAFVPFEGRGFMFQGMQLVIAHCFGVMKLHRLEANVQPENARSIALVQALGFQREGFSPRYLKVCGKWRDHERWALLTEWWRGSA
jgi:ribosomal-protein-alanine N-acetyltransferase